MSEICQTYYIKTTKVINLWGDPSSLCKYSVSLRLLPTNTTFQSGSCLPQFSLWCSNGNYLFLSLPLHSFIGIFCKQELSFHHHSFMIRSFIYVSELMDINFVPWILIQDYRYVFYFSPCSTFSHLYLSDWHLCPFDISPARSPTFFSLQCFMASQDVVGASPSPGVNHHPGRLHPGSLC